MDSEIAERLKGKPTVISAIDLATEQLPAALQPWLVDLVLWSVEHDPDFEAVKLVSSDIDKQGVIRAIDGWCRYENGEAAGHGPLSSWFEDFTARSRSEILKPAFWCEQAPELHVIAVK